MVFQMKYCMYQVQVYRATVSHEQPRVVFDEAAILKPFRAADSCALQHSCVTAAFATAVESTLYCSILVCKT